MVFPDGLGDGFLPLGDLDKTEEVVHLVLGFSYPLRKALLLHAFFIYITDRS